MTNDDGINIVLACQLQCISQPWAFAHDHAAKIEQHWQARLQTHPLNFNGVIYLLATENMVRTGAVAHFSACFYETDFKSFLYWRDLGYPSAMARDSFGSAILRSNEGHILLGRQTAGHINSGLAYLPGGFIDQRDVAADGNIDIGASIARELGEETGLDIAGLTIEPGFRIIRCGSLISMAREFRSHLPAVELRETILQSLAADPCPELSDIIIITPQTDLDQINIPPYSKMALRHVLQTPTT